MTPFPHPHRYGAAPTFDRGRLAHRGAPRRWHAQAWLHALLLAIAPLLVIGFYSVVDGAVERAALRRLAAPQAGPAPTASRLRPVAWECDARPGAGLHSDCRPVPAGPVRASASDG